jgi:cobalt-zinc-cadmium efflux system outer membrane protein
MDGNWRIWILVALGTAELSLQAGEGATSPPPLTFETAWRLTQQRNPDLAVTGFATAVASASAHQAGLRPNPTVGIEVENFAGSGDSSGFDAAEYTASVEQTIECGGKRSARVRAARADVRAAGIETRRQRLDLLCDAADRYVDVAFAQDRLALRVELTRVADEFAQATAARVAAGKAPAMESARAATASARARSRLEAARGESAAARVLLSALWAGSPAEFGPVAEGLESLDGQPPPGWTPNLATNPLVAAASESAIERQTAESALARAESVPDLAVAAGARYAGESDTLAWVAGLSLPLPVFDRGRARRAEAAAALAQVCATTRAEATRSAADIAACAAQRTARWAAVAALRETAASQETAAKATREGYTGGKFTYLEALDAQREWFETREELLDALAAARHADVALARATATDWTGNKE